MSKYIEITNAKGEITLTNEYVPMTIVENIRLRDGRHYITTEGFKVIGCDGSAKILVAVDTQGVQVRVENSTADVVVYDVQNKSSSAGELVVYSDKGVPIYSNRDKHIAVYSSGLTMTNGPKVTNQGEQAIIYHATNDKVKYVSIAPFYGVGMITPMGHLGPSYRNIYFDNPSSLRYEERFLGTRFAGETGGSGHQVFAGTFTPLYIFEQVF